MARQPQSKYYKYENRRDRKWLTFKKIFFPALMVTGALGSLILNIITNKAEWPVSLQWFGAALLYTALLFRNK